MVDYSEKSSLKSGLGELHSSQKSIAQTLSVFEIIISDEIVVCVHTRPLVHFKARIVHSNRIWHVSN